MAKKIKLRGCPLCGAKAHWTKGDKGTRMLDRVECSECFLALEGHYQPQSALAAWNTRIMDMYIEDREVNIEGENL